MKEKKSIIIAVVILLLVLVGAVGASYAYFATTTKTTGNDKNLNIVTENLGDIKWEGTKVYTSGDLLPGECGIQTFTIEKNSASGKGIYEIDLKGMLDESFGTDVEITLYKSTNPTTNNVTIKEGNSTISGDTTKQYYKEDSVVLNGTPEKVYGTKALQNKDKIILEQADFDNSNLQKTTYYLVYCYKNNGNQDHQQGKSFSGEISVRLILEKTAPEIIGEKATDAVTMLANYDTTNLATDDYGNSRYIGAAPNNYVRIEGEEYARDVYYGYRSSTSTEYAKYSSLAECTKAPSYNKNCKVGIPKGTPILWRIIGVMKDIDDGTGNKEDRVKLIRSEAMGWYSWDTSDDSVNSGMGVNEWSQADLMKLLNPGYEDESVGGSLYWNSGSGTCYYDGDNYTESCNFTSTGIKEKLKALIGDAVWNTGSNGPGDYKSASNGLVKHFYTYERSENTGKICTSGVYCNDTVERTTTWTGKVGLMYPSDYGYATSGGSTTDRATCLNTALRNWSNWDDPYENPGWDGVKECFANDWLYKDFMSQWTISPRADSSSAYFAFAVSTMGSNGSTNASLHNEVRPVVYLKPNVLISSGTGSESDPFVLEG